VLSDLHSESFAEINLNFDESLFKNFDKRYNSINKQDVKIPKPSFHTTSRKRRTVVIMNRIDIKLTEKEEQWCEHNVNIPELSSLTSQPQEYNF